MKERYDGSSLKEGWWGDRRREGEKDKVVVAALKAGVSGSKVVNHTFVSKENIRATCQQLVPTLMSY